MSCPTSVGARLRVRAPAKVNLCLFLGPVREDGRHELVTLFESVSLYDDLVISVDASDQVVCAGVEGPNLVAEALAGLRARGWQAPPVRVEITKRIPVAAGMGGGSADAAALLRVAPELGALSRAAPELGALSRAAPELGALSRAAPELGARSRAGPDLGALSRAGPESGPVPDAAALRALAASLGADVPAQLTPGLVLGTGAGEVVQPREPLAPHGLVVVPLVERLSTASVYAEADRLGLPRGREQLEARSRDVERAVRPGARLPASLMINDLEPAARSLCPPISSVRDAVRDADADEVFVSGSGPTVAGLFWGEDGAGRAEAAASLLARRFPAATAVSPITAVAPAASSACGKI